MARPVTDQTTVAVYELDEETRHAWSGPLAEFETINDFDAATRLSVRRQLATDGAVTFGGGASPVYRVEID